LSVDESVTIDEIEVNVFLLVFVCSNGDFQVHNLFYGLFFIFRELRAALELFRSLFELDKQVKGISGDKYGFSSIFQVLGLGPVLPDSSKNEVPTILSLKLEDSLIVFNVGQALELHPLIYSLFFRALFSLSSCALHQSISLFELIRSFLFSSLGLCLERVEVGGHLLRSGCRSLEPRVCFDLVQSVARFRILTKHADKKI